MLAEWLSPLLEWLGLGIVPFLMLIILIVVVIRG